MNKNEYLKQVERFLLDLEVTQRAKIISELSQTELDENTPALVLANTKRQELGLAVYHEKSSSSFMRSFFKFMAAMFIIFLLFLSFLIWKFTPLFKIDEEQQRVVILGGLIDIDGKAGKFKVGDTYHFEQSKYLNEFQSAIELDEATDEIILLIESGKVDLKTSVNTTLKINCQMQEPPKENHIAKNSDSLKFDFQNKNGSCVLEIPVGKKVLVEAEAGSINILDPEFNAYIELENGNIAVREVPEMNYQYNFELTQGFQDDFESSDAADAYEINLKLNTGNIIQFKE